MFKLLRERLPSFTQDQTPSYRDIKQGYRLPQCAVLILPTSCSHSENFPPSRAPKQAMMSTSYHAELFSNQAAYLLQNKQRQSWVKEAEAGAERGDDEG